MAAVIGAACMTVVRSAARHAGLIERTVPQAIEERLFPREPDEPSAHRAWEQVLHLGYGAAMGTAYGFAAGKRVRSSAGSALALGVGAWLLGAAVVVPLIGAGRGLWDRSAKENAVDLFAHLVFGAATELVRDDLSEHEHTGELPREARHAAELG